MNAVHIVHGQVSQNVRTSSVLRNGSVVVARVLSRNGDGSYTVSIAGQMIEVRSQVPLQKGQVFQAKVGMTGNQLSLALVSESNHTGELVQKLPVQNQNLSPQLQNFLSSLGFEPNLDSFKIVQFMQQIGMKFDVESAKKALNLSKKNGMVRQEKAQIALLLEEKGIAASDERVSAILGKNPHDSEDSHQQEKKENKQLEERNEQLGLRSEELAVGRAQGAVDDGFSVNSVKFVRDFFDSVDSTSLSHKNGVLSAFNTVLSSRKNEIPLNHWIVLPFEWNFQDSFGTIRLLFDSELKNLQKAIIDLKNSANQHKFLLGFEKNQLSSVRFATSLAVSDDAKNALSNLFADFYGKTVSVERVDFDSLRGFCAGDEIFVQVQGEA